MANVFAVHSAGSSIATYLRNAYPETLRAEHPCSFQVMSTGELESPDVESIAPAVTLILYAVTLNEHFRSSPNIGRTDDASVPLSLDLHYLMSAWAENALTEHTILTWAMLELHQHPFLRAPDLSSEAAWDASDMLHILPEELPTDTMTSIWDSFGPSYRLSTGYVVRVVRVDAERVPDGLPVVATRYRYEEFDGVRT